MKGDFLSETIKRKKEEIEKKKRQRPISEDDLSFLAKPPSFYEALTKGDPPRIIAEVKRRSPSKGSIKEEIDAASWASLYEKAQAKAISVLTDSAFKGSMDDLISVIQKVTIPVLRKDFIIDKYQLYESALAGASAVLLIAAALSKDELREFVERAFLLGVEPVVEIHTEHELENALFSTARIIGINNRDLRTLNVDLSFTESLAPKIPDDKVIISESGIKSKNDIQRLLRAGVENFLIGEALMKAKDPVKKLKELLGL